MHIGQLVQRQRAIAGAEEVLVDVFRLLWWLTWRRWTRIVD